MDFEPWMEDVIAQHEAELTEVVREKTGNPDLVVDDRRPLLRSEKPRRWPEDFRGFGSNVRPKNQR